MTSRESTAIAKENPQAATRVIERIRDVVARLEYAPYSGTLTSKPGIHRLPVVTDPYLIFYEIFHDEVANVDVLNAPLMIASHPPAMVTRTRLRAVLTALGLYTVAALIIGYFGLSAYTGAHGLKAKQDLAQQQTTLTQERDRLTAERKAWEHKVSLLRGDNLDPDMLDERARAKLNYLHPRDLTLILKK